VKLLESRVFAIAVGIIVSLCDVLIHSEISWIIISIIIYCTVFFLKTRFDFWLENKTTKWYLLIKSIAAALTTIIFIHIIYTGYLIFPFIEMYFRH
jgi:hypothetical protein